MPPQMLGALPRVRRASSYPATSLETAIVELRRRRDALRALTRGEHPPAEWVAEHDRVEDLLIGALQEQRRRRERTTA